jgi:hypothetical protein
MVKLADERIHELAAEAVNNFRDDPRCFGALKVFLDELDAAHALTDHITAVIKKDRDRAARLVLDDEEPSRNAIAYAIVNG